MQTSIRKPYIQVRQIETGFPAYLEKPELSVWEKICMSPKTTTLIIAGLILVTDLFILNSNAVIISKTHNIVLSAHQSVSSAGQHKPNSLVKKQLPEEDFNQAEIDKQIVEMEKLISEQRKRIESRKVESPANASAVASPEPIVNKTNFFKGSAKKARRFKSSVVSKSDFPSRAELQNKVENANITKASSQNSTPHKLISLQASDNFLPIQPLVSTPTQYSLLPSSGVAQYSQYQNVVKPNPTAAPIKLAQDSRGKTKKDGVYHFNELIDENRSLYKNRSSESEDEE